MTVDVLKRNSICDDCEKVYNYWEVSEYRARGGRVGLAQTVEVNLRHCARLPSSLLNIQDKLQPFSNFLKIIFRIALHSRNLGKLDEVVCVQMFGLHHCLFCGRTFKFED